jgi:hypothetical protein
MELKMKKIILFSILSLNIYATEYKIEINKTNYDNTISVEAYVDPTVTCESPEILNEEKTGCINPIPTCTLPEVLNETEDACIETTEKVGWIFTSGDSCNGMRPALFDSNVYFARANTRIQNLNLEIPEGYRWVTKSEYNSLFVASAVPNKTSLGYKYYNRCGLSGYPQINGVTQFVFLLKDNGSYGIHAGQSEHYGTTANPHFYSDSDQMAGYVLYKEF